jgi:hypothetical protein
MKTQVGRSLFVRHEFLADVIFQSNRFREALAALTLLSTVAIASADQFGDFGYTITNSNAVVITNYTGLGGAVAIPDSIYGLPVTVISSYSFFGKTSLVHVTIPNSVTTIEYFSFLNCSNLAEIIIPNGVTNIGYEAFYACTNATNVSIGTNVAFIDNDVFGACTGLTNLSIPAAVTYIGQSAFEACRNLKSIAVDPLNSTYCSIDGVLLTKDQTTVLLCPQAKAGAYTAPGALTSVAPHAFEACVKITSVVLPDAVTNIGDVAFYECNAVTSVTIPSSLLRIGQYAFSDCFLLGSLNLPSGLTSIGIGAFENCYSFTSIAIPYGITTIPDFTFFRCSQITSVTIPNTVTYIGNSAFGSCSGLRQITIPDNVTYIGNSAFSSCQKLTSIKIPAGVTTLGASAFASCYALTNVFFIGNAPTTVGTGLFTGDNNLTVYFLVGTSGWGPAFGGRPTAFWNPLIQNVATSGNQFHFTVTGPTNLVTFIEASSSLENPVWSTVRTNSLTGGSYTFTDTTNYPARFYRIRSQ